MSEEFIRKQQAFHNNPGINPDTGKKLIKDKGPYLKFVELYGLPVIAPIKLPGKIVLRLSFPFLNLPEDIIQEILKYLRGDTLSNMLVTNKSFHAMKLKFKENIFKNALQRELNRAIPKYKTYYQRGVMDIEVGDRLTDSYLNYRVIQIKGKSGKLIHVDMLGNKISDAICDINLYNDGKRRYFWFITDPDKQEHEARFGILRRDYGMRIKSVDSKYLKYKSSPFFDDNDDREPEINMMVLVKKYVEDHQFSFVLEYFISTLTDETMTLKYVDGCKDENKIVETLEVVKIDDHWIIASDQTFKILQIGAGIG